MSKQKKKGTWFESKVVDFQNIRSALTWMLNHEMIKDKSEYVTIKCSIERMEEIANELKNVKVEQ